MGWAGPFAEAVASGRGFFSGRHLVGEDGPEQAVVSAEVHECLWEAEVVAG